MVNFKPVAREHLDELQIQQRDIERRRKEEAERKLRFFDHKRRTFGLDTDAIQQQCQDRIQRKEQERQQNEEIARVAKQYAQESDSIFEQAMQQKRLRDLKIAQHQKSVRREDADTFDLNDPKSVRNSEPPRTGDEPVPVSSMQCFEGEDLGKTERVALQRQQIRDWNAELSQEKLRRKSEAESETARYVAERDRMVDLANQTEQFKIKAKLSEAIAAASVQLKQQNEKRQQNENERAENVRRGVEEVENMLQSTWLTEAPEATISATSSNRYIPYNFKGFSKEQRQSILDSQTAQIEANTAQRENEKLAERAFTNEQNEMRRQFLIQQRLLNKKKLERKCHLAAYQRQQMDNAEQRKKMLDDLLKNEVTEEFFSQFQTSSR